jgi:hypothetical protein
MDLGGGMVDYLFCLVGQCNGILTPLQCLVCLGGRNTVAGCIIHTVHITENEIAQWAKLKQHTLKLHITVGETETAHH